MEEARLFALPEGIVVAQIQITEHGLLIETTATAPTARCPACFEVSDSIHCHYRRMLRDVPCAGRQVQLLLTVRKFTCRNPACSRKVFAERLPDFVQPHARTTSRHTEQITSIGLATCGQGGARLASRLGIHTSRHTILRHILALPDVSTGSVLWLGIDEFAFRRGYRFGTILVNLESHRVVDLLPNRDAASAAAWMRQHPDLTVVSRDRGSEYARAASAGAAQALQCADRFHLVKNLTEITQLLLARCQAAILETSKTKVQQQDDPNRSPITIEEWRAIRTSLRQEDTAGPSHRALRTLPARDRVAHPRADASKESVISELQSFAAGIEKDKEAVKAGLSWSINNGMVEGHVTKLKLIKRQGYGRASFPLLRKRVLHAV